MFSSLPTEVAGIPVWAILFVVAGIMFFLLRVTADPLNQDNFPTLRLFLYILAIFIGIVGVADFIRANSLL